MTCALVTGGSRGIGRAICLKLAAMGYHILINYRSNLDEANLTLAALREQGGDGELLPFDVGDKDAVVRGLSAWLEKNTDKKIEVLVNNAGIREDALMSWMTDEQWENVLRTNLDSIFYVTRQLLQPMLANRYGRIINIVSLSGLKGVAGQVNYSAAKAGVIGATKALAQEVGRFGITVNAVAPGYIRTDMTEGIDEKQASQMIPVRRFGMPEEVAHAVAFFASREAGYVTAEVLSVNGGLYS